ncbi:trypsin-like peptidase domain-containing protein [Streptomyces hainanensis]|uniref:Serine protease n=1 Tax=Streptomyces hainanensis TaxID=402648 RepID=A0A4R4SSM4_9ACTN|nr:trypsin-like peptidase domain-containing protein [Streptomyces hainanensis]TDC64813.1 serine protease [Streptomyces hainanensis]
MAVDSVATADPAGALVRVGDLAGRPRGVAFRADTDGTLVTSHEAVDGLARLVLGEPGGASRVVDAATVTELPHWDLALIRAPEPPCPVEPLVIAPDRAGPARLRLADAWTDATLYAPGRPAVYTATDRFHRIDEALELQLPPGAAVGLRLDAAHTGSPVVDPATGAVLAVLTTALHAPGRSAGFAVPLHTAATLEGTGPLAALLRRNGATVPGFGAALNPAGVGALAADSLARAGIRPTRHDRPELGGELVEFERGSATVAALVGLPGTGRTTLLAAHATDRPGTVWLRGADLLPGDGGLRDAVGRALARTDPDVAARTARDGGRPLLVVLDGPEEMPEELAARLAAWVPTTVGWLRAVGARLVLACRPEHWERAGRLFPPGTLHGRPAGRLPAHLPIGDLAPEPAGRVRAAAGLDPAGLAPGEAAHPLSLRMLADIRAAQPADAGGAPDRSGIFSAHLDLVALRLAETLAGGAADRAAAARTAARIHQAARRSAVTGALPRRAFDALFPWSGGWARAVLDHGVLRPAGAEYRFADEEFADWLHGRHLDLDAALPAAARGDLPRHRAGAVGHALLHRCARQGPDALRGLLPLPVADTPVERSWWAARLSHQVLPALPDAHALLPELRGLADRIGAGAVPAEPFTPDFWRALAIDAHHRLDLLRRLLPADRPPHPGGGPRYLTAASELLAAEPTTLPLLRHWFDDDRPLRAAPDLVPPRDLTVASAAQALLHTHRRLALDEITDTLADAEHPCADEVLADLVHDEPAALCRAVERWAQDRRPERRADAVAYGLRTAGRSPRALTDADRALLRYAARALLDRPEDVTLHPSACALLVQAWARPPDGTRGSGGSVVDGGCAGGLGKAGVSRPEGARYRGPAGPGG